MSAADETDEAPPDASGSTRQIRSEPAAWRRTWSRRPRCCSPRSRTRTATEGQPPRRSASASRAGVLSISNDEVFAAATRQLVAAATGEGDGFRLEVALAEAAATPRVICETACDLAQLAAHLAHTCDGVRRADYVGVAHLVGGSSLRRCRARAQQPRHQRRRLAPHEGERAAAEAVRAASRGETRAGSARPGEAEPRPSVGVEAALELAPQRGCRLDPVGRERLLEVAHRAWRDTPRPARRAPRCHRSAHARPAAAWPPRPRPAVRATAGRAVRRSALRGGSLRHRGHDGRSDRFSSHSHPSASRRSRRRARQREMRLAIVPLGMPRASPI